MTADEGPGVTGIGAEPPTAIGQRALLVRAGSRNVLWDMISYIDADLVTHINRLGGISAIAISHPHFYGSMIEWAHAFNAPSTYTPPTASGSPAPTAQWSSGAATHARSAPA